MSHAQTEGDEPSRKLTRTQMEQDDAKLDDVWVLVFKRLPLRDRIRVEGVCKKWRDLMPYTDVTKVDLNELFATKDNKQRPEIHELTKDDGLLRVLMGVLDRCGRYLRWLDLKLGAYPHSFLCWNKALADLVVEKASNLVVLNLTYRLVSLEGLFAMKNLTKLEELRMSQDEVDFTREADLSTPPPLDQIKSAVGATIQSLPSLKKLYLLEFFKDEWKVFYPPVRNSNLRELRLTGITVTAADVRDLVQHCPNLQVLDWRSLPDNLDVQLGALGDLHQLTELHLSSGILTDGGLAAICRGCPKLENLDLFVRGLTSCSELWRLPNLKCLEIASIGSAVDDAALTSVAKYGRLEKVSLTKADLTDEGLKKLTLCPNLMGLTIVDIKKITDEGLAVVLDSCKKLTHLNCCSTSIGDASVAAIGARAFNLRRCYMMDTRVTVPGLRSLIEEREKRLEEGEELQLKPLTLCYSLPCCIIGPKERLDRVKLIFYFMRGHS